MEKVKENRAPFLREPFDQAILVTAFVVGAVGIIVMKLLQSPIMLPMVFAALVLVAYAMSASLSSRTKIEPETIGDNCYYLGFLFTLTSLGIVLFQIAGPGADQEMFRRVIGGFGLALSSTIFGVFLRILFMQARHDLVAREKEAQRDLFSATRDFRTALAQSTSEVKSFSTEVTQLASETVERLRDVSARADAIQRDAAEKAATVQRETAEKVAAIERETAEKVSLVHREAAEKAAAASISTVEASLAKASTLVQEAVREAAITTTKEAAQGVAKEIERGAEFFKAQYEALANELRKQADDTRSTMQILAELRAGSADQMTAMTSQMEAVARAAAQAGVALRAVEPGVEAANSALSGSIVQVIGKLSGSLEHLATETESTRAALVRFREAELSTAARTKRGSMWGRMKRRFSREAT